MIRFKAIIFIIISGIMLTACATFIKDDDVLSLKNYEKSLYVLKQDVGDGKFTLKKGEKVKLFIVTDDDSIKAYCYPEGVEFLKSDRTLLLYLFEDEFEKNKFDMKKFDEMLFSKIEAVK